MFVIRTLAKLRLQHLCFLRLHLPLLLELLVPLKTVVIYTAIIKGTQHFSFQVEVCTYRNN